MQPFRRLVLNVWIKGGEFTSRDSGQCARDALDGGAQLREHESKRLDSGVAVVLGNVSKVVQGLFGRKLHLD